MKKTFLYQSQTIFYEDAGSGDIVVLLHGFGEDGNIWQQQADAISSRFRVIIPDLPGSGLSQIKNDAYDLVKSIEAMAAAMSALIRSITNQPVTILGHSMGGYILLAMAEQSFVSKTPGALPIKAWGLIHSTAFADTEEKKATRRKAITSIEKNGSMPFLETAIPGLFSEAFKKDHPEQVTALVEKGTSFAPKALTSYYEAMLQRPDRTAALRSSDAPVLFIIGKEDKAAPMEDVLQQVSLPGTAYVHILDTGHMSMLEDSKNLNKHLLDFLKDTR